MIVPACWSPPKLCDANRVDHVDALKRDAGDAFQGPRLVVVDQDFGRGQHAAAGMARQCLDDDVGHIRVKQHAVESQAGDRCQHAISRIDLAESKRREFEQLVGAGAVADRNFHSQ